ncbi:N-6 DNA methylase [Deinococcus soli (ex Cha et al. 2016)]|uniref:site-specific DNA-methyltransferase (adenine-specific) n=1 Tax=Deinococcus soli (ex Cha et al. 2016) TaxID=1309411 RepID=A0A0F7JKJ2_9DEIO|nr:N-6 DNA methylase [Deinococcus soli (ex Cha et al. 2016)]AKH16746.1 hypothetical protein SY84_06380 [Deinococcus soli (ex Cha et al. 2016)]
MTALDTALRRTLERAIIEARDAAEEAARQALDTLLLHNQRTGDLDHLDDDARKLRRRLQAKEKQLGGREALVRECAYEQWHTMLFARFLEANGLLMHPEGVSVSLTDCAELAADEGEPDAYAVAAKYAALMLPGIFRPQDPLLQVRFAPEHRQTLEALLDGIPKPAYTADDGLGWVYQFWQARRKKQVNDSGRKIAGADISPVTQLFTEHYMVQFMLHNTIGAWWTARHPDQPLPTEKSYLRTLEDGTPAAGTFDGWPATVKELKVIDPCCGSGHFLVAAFALLRRLRMIEEGLSEAEAAEAVLRDNLHGLELDPRCTQLAAFNLTLEAWKAGGYREVPVPHVACSGIPVGADVNDWLALVDDTNTKMVLRDLHAEFKNATDLGSLINPRQTVEALGMFGEDALQDLAGLMDKLGKGEKKEDPASAIFGETVEGVAKAAHLLNGSYHFVVTNVPYLARAKQGEVLADFVERRFPMGKADLASVFVERCREFAKKGGTYALVTPQNWLFLGSYKKLRENLLRDQKWDWVARLGSGAFETISGEVVNVALLAMSNVRPGRENRIMGVEASHSKTVNEKMNSLLLGDLVEVNQAAQADKTDSIISFRNNDKGVAISEVAGCYKGITTGDDSRYRRRFWEIVICPENKWHYYQSSITQESSCGCSYVEDIEGIQNASGAYIRGREAWGKKGIAISQMSSLSAGRYSGARFDTNVAALIPSNESDLAAFWLFAESGGLASSIRDVNQKGNVDNGYILKASIDIEYWRQQAQEKLPQGLLEIRSEDPTQWMFKGTIDDTSEPLQVAMARLLGYAWPEQVKDDVVPDADGIVCLPPVAGEKAAHERLLDALAQGFGSAWTPAKLAELLAGVGSPDLATWLRDKFFEQHAKLFHHRPFLWHIWDGRKDGFSAIVNYHGLDRARLEKLTYTYLGNWINQQQAEVSAKTAGAEARLVAARELQGKLEAILAGEPPYDIYVRWKPLHEQALGWAPDLNDGVRLNIRPFVMAGVLRAKVNVKWTKDRGNDPKPNASGTTERHNDLHLTLDEKRRARAGVQAPA